MEKSFEETVKSLTAKEIIMSMVEGLKNPVVKINMQTFGNAFGNVCYGCASTNTICKIANIVFTPENIWYREEVLNVDPYFLQCFEIAIDNLRRGNLHNYNNCVYGAKIAKIINPKNIKLKELTSNYTTEDLNCYIRLANSQ